MFVLNKSKVILWYSERKREPLRKFIKTNKRGRTIVIGKIYEMVQKILWSIRKNEGVANVVAIIPSTKAPVK